MKIEHRLALLMGSTALVSFILGLGFGVLVA